MVVEEGEGVQHNRRRIHALSKLAQESLTIIIRAKDLLPAVTAAGGVVEGVGEVGARRPCHDPHTISRPISPCQGQLAVKV
jgi:hypothetical protein